MGQTGAVDVEEARRILGVDPGAEPSLLREAHRREIRRAHPDAGGSATAAAGVNEAWAVLRSLGGAEATAAGTSSSPPPSVSQPLPVDADVDAYYLVSAEPGELLARLAEAGHEVGEVVFVDPHVGLLEIVVGNPPAVGQLAVTVGVTSSAGTEVSFTLEALGVTPAPPIGPVVDALMAAVSR